MSPCVDEDSCGSLSSARRARREEAEKWQEEEWGERNSSRPNSAPYSSTPMGGDGADEQTGLLQPYPGISSYNFIGSSKSIGSSNFLLPGPTKRPIPDLRRVGGSYQKKSVQRKKERVGRLMKERNRNAKRKGQKKQQKKRRRAARVTPHLRRSHFKARAITERFLGLINAEVSFSNEHCSLSSLCLAFICIVSFFGNRDCV